MKLQLSRKNKEVKMESVATPAVQFVQPESHPNATLSLIGGLVIGSVLTSAGFLAYYNHGSSNNEGNPIIVASATPCSQPLDIDGIGIKINELRIQKGYNQLSRDSNLEKFAQLRSVEVSKTGQYNHKGKYGSYYDWAKEVKVPYTNLESIGEDLVANVTSSCNAVEQWKASPTHLNSITDSKYTTFGVGYIDSFAVVILGNPLESTPNPTVIVVPQKEAPTRYPTAPVTNIGGEVTTCGTPDLIGNTTCRTY